MSTQKFPVTFLGGHSPREGLLGLITYPDMLDGAPFCRFYTWNQGQWGRGQNDMRFNCVSITYLSDASRDYKAWWLLGKNGEAVEIGRVWTTEQIDGAGLNMEKPYGYVNAIRNIQGRLYVCGYGRQVYQRDAGWISIADPILTRESALGFFDIDGSSHTDIYAVGFRGEIYHYDSKVWRKDDSPTDTHLTTVRSLDQNNVWIAGNKGIVLHGSFNRWRIIQDPGFTGNWYSVEEFNGRIYLAGHGVLGVVEGNGIRLVDVGAGRGITTHRLHAREGLLWSVGEKDIFVFDGKTWKEVLHPDNT